MRRNVTGCREVLCREHFHVANAIGAVIAQLSGEIVDVEDIRLSYRPGNVTRVRIKAVRNLPDHDTSPCSATEMPINEPASAPAAEPKIAPTIG